MTVFKITLMAAFLGLAGLAQAEVFKCVDENGKITFSDTACPGAKKGENQKVTPSKPSESQSEKKRRPGYAGFIDRGKDFSEQHKDEKK